MTFLNEQLLKIGGKNIVSRRELEVYQGTDYKDFLTKGMYRDLGEEILKTIPVQDILQTDTGNRELLVEVYLVKDPREFLTLIDKYICEAYQMGKDGDALDPLRRLMGLIR